MRKISILDNGDGTYGIMHCRIVVGNLIVARVGSNLKADKRLADYFKESDGNEYASCDEFVDKHNLEVIASIDQECHIIVEFNYFKDKLYFVGRGITDNFDRARRYEDIASAQSALSAGIAGGYMHEYMYIIQPYFEDEANESEAD